MPGTLILNAMLHVDTAHRSELQHLLPAHAWLQDMDESTIAWHTAAAAIDTLHLHLHRANFDLWHLEDQARDTYAEDRIIAEVKRGIDRTNQRRNDLVEQLDSALLAALDLYGLPRPDTTLHSETPGMIVDRLSILSLKRFHMREESLRSEASPEHRQRSAARLGILNTQSEALAGCLAELWQEICTGKRRFAVYRQMKMYNDPTLNPVLYTAETPTSASGS